MQLTRWEDGDNINMPITTYEGENYYNNNNNNSSTRQTNGKFKAILAKLKSKGITKIEPSFEPSLGFHYREFQEYSLYDLQSIFTSLEKEGVVRHQLFDSVLSCRYCNSSYRFSTKFLCSICRSPNIIRGSVIEHLGCGNIDFEEIYLNEDGTLLCRKCRKQLKAIGVDYSRPGYFYKCVTCQATLPNVEHQFICLGCGKTSMQDDLDTLQLFSYTVVDSQRLSTLLLNHSSNSSKNNSSSNNNGSNSDNFLIYVVEALGRTGIKVASPGTVTGFSKLKTTFELVVYDEKDIPLMVADTNITSDSVREEKEDDEETRKLLSFYAKCIDVSLQIRKDITKLLIVIPRLRQDVNDLAKTYGIITIESDTKNGAIPKIIQAIIKAYIDVRKSNATSNITTTTAAAATSPRSLSSSSSSSFSL